MSIKFDVDPFADVAAAFARLWPDKNARVLFVMGLYAKTKAYGRTNFRKKKSPVIAIDAEVPLYGAVDVLVHELAHVAAGLHAGHGKKWKAAYDRLCRELAA